jgi:hypothetical protein
MLDFYSAADILLLPQPEGVSLTYLRSDGGTTPSLRLMWGGQAE